MHEWVSIIRKVLALKPHEDILVPKASVKHPLTIGFRRSIGEPKGQSADYRLRLSDGKSIHVREYRDCYKVHWDMVDPSVDPIRHLKYDAPHWYKMIIYTSGVLGSILTTKVRSNPVLGLVGVALLLMAELSMNK